MSEPRHPACPVDEEVSWLLQRAGESTRGDGLVAGLRALWRFALRESVDAAGEPSGHVPVLHLAPEQHLGARGQVTIALADHENTVLLRLRAWLDTPKGVMVLENLARTHARLLLGGDRWSHADPQPGAESLAPLTLASILGDPESLIRALKPGH